MRVAADAGLRQVDDVHFTARLRDRFAEGHAVSPDRRPARILLDAVAVDEERRDALQAIGLFRVALPRRLDGDQRLDLVGPRLRHLEAELPSLRVEQDHAGTHLVDERGVGGDDRIVGRRPARHDLAHEVVVAVDRELAALHAEAAERLVLRQEQRLALEDVGVHRPARAAALDGVGVVDVPALSYEPVEPAFATVGRGLVGDARQAAAVPHEHRHGTARLGGQKILDVHRLDEIGAVQVHLGRHTARREHHLLHRLVAHRDFAPADVERSHVAQRDRALRAAGEQSCAYHVAQAHVDEKP